MSRRGYFILFLGLLLLGVGNPEDKCEPPSGLDSVPGLSQAKSFWQWISGDNNGAKCTQENFSKGAPIISQIRSAVEAGQGNEQAAKETQEFFLDNLVQTAEGTPGLGHVIGAVQVATGDTERGEETLKGASRSTAVLVGGALGGPGAAIASGIAFDGLVTGIQSGIDGKLTPFGVVDTIANIDEISKSPGKSFDSTVGLALDAFGTSSKGKKNAGKNKEGSSKDKPDGDTSKDKPEGDTSKDKPDSDSDSQHGGDVGEDGTKFGSSSSDGMADSSPPGSPNMNLINANLNQQLTIRESWEYNAVNTFNLADNCYLCTIAAMRRDNVAGLLNQLGIMQTGHADLNYIRQLFMEAGYPNVLYQQFDNSNQLQNFLNNVMPSGVKREFGLAYLNPPPASDGHVVVLKAWKTVGGILGYRMIDFQQAPLSSDRFHENLLPGGTSYLFDMNPHELVPGGNINNQATFSGLKMSAKEKAMWIDLNELAKTGAFQSIKTVGRNNQTIFTNGFNKNPNVDLLENGSKRVVVDNKFFFTSGCAAPAHLCGKKIIGYYTSFGSKLFTVYQAQRLTHVIFAFLEMNADGTVSDNLDAEGLQRLQGLFKIGQYFPHLKIMFAVGGWENSQYFSGMASSSSGRQKFISSVVSIIQKWNFNGIDIDWEFPVAGGANEGIAGDKENYVQLMSELRQTLDNLGPDYLISFASAAGQWTLNPGFDLPGLLESANWVNVMTYDYFGAWESQWGAFTGPPAPLYFGAPKKWSGKLNADWTLKYYACRLKNTDQIVMGVPFYGRYWNNVGPPVNASDGMWRLAMAKDGKTQGGAANWQEIKQKYLGDASFEKHFHETVKAPYMWNPSQNTFLGYEDEKSLQFKVEYAVSKNLGGIMIWAVDLDDDDLSLLNVVYKAPLCTSSTSVNYKCSPIADKRWWTWDDSKENAGMCGKSSPLYKGFYPVCDPEDDAFSCCGAYGYCGSDEDFCSCPTCVDYGNHPEKILDEPVKPTGPVRWYYNNAPEGKRGRCGRDIEKVNGDYPICNPDDPNAHCCSNGFYCGTGAASCDCDTCIDFKKNPSFEFKEKTWFDWSDGEEKSGTCGETAPRLNGKIAQCNPDSQWPCCSEFGRCGDSDEHCKCSKCVDYRKS